MNDTNVAARFFLSRSRCPSNIALEVEKKVYSYQSLGMEALKLASLLNNINSNSQFVGLFAYRSYAAYLGILAITSAGKAYLPFNPKFPLERIKSMIEISGCTMFIASQEFYPLIKELLQNTNEKYIFIFPEEKVLPTIGNTFKGFCQTDIDYQHAVLTEVKDIKPDDIVYLLFTSGTTGKPKGIPISHNNLNSYLDYVQKKYPVVESDRCSQAFDTTFDPSMHDIWVTWSAAATLCAIPQASLLAPAKFINEKKLTIWYSVPSIAAFLRKTRILKPNIFPLLRYSIFSGEALPADLAADWQKAAPSSSLINYYGPTEITINITDYVFKPGVTDKSLNNVIALGAVFDSHLYKIVDVNLKQLLVNETGELIISGPQVSAGYINNPLKNKESFVELDGKVWYRTGDLVKIDSEGSIFYVGRIDHQVKIRGYRVEMAEIEYVVKKISKAENAVAIPFPINNNIAEGIICFLETKKLIDIALVLSKAGNLLPDYMIPKEIIVLASLPININGKVDRNALINLLKG